MYRLIIVLVAVLVMPATAMAEVRAGSVNDPDDQAQPFDLEQTRVAFDNGAGTATFVVRTYEPLPEKVTSAATFLYLQLGRPYAYMSGCATDQRGAVTISIRPPSYSTTAYAASVGIKGEYDTKYVDAPVSLSADRREATVTVTDPILVGIDNQCFTGSASWNENSENPDMPDSGYDSGDTGWFPGFDPNPSESVEPTGPKVTRITMHEEGGWKNSYFSFSFMPGRCEKWVKTPVQVTLSGYGDTESMRFNGDCDAPQFNRSGDVSHMKVRRYSKRRIDITPTSKRRINKTYWYRYRAEVAGDTVRSGRIKVEYRFRRSKRVYGFKPNGDINDRYWNYCVNNGKQVWMHNGNPYCVTNGARYWVAWKKR